MNNFDLIQKTHILFGKNEESKVGKLIKDYADSCLIVHDGGAYLENLLITIKNVLKDAGITYFELPGVKANPLLSKANEGVKICRENNIEFVLAVGGGSVMDTAKYISFAVNCDFDVRKLVPELIIKHKVLPHGAVVTLSGTSSECSNCAMIVDDLNEQVVKYALSNTALYFDFSIINPELTYSLPKKQLAAGVMDAISHALEVYLAPEKEEPLMEGYMETVIKTLLRYGPLAMQDPTNYEIRSTISICVMMAYNDNLSNGGIAQDWGGHGIENPVTALYNGTHGVNLGILTPAFLRYTSKKNYRPFWNFAVRCMDVNPLEKTKCEIIEEGAVKLEEWLKQMSLPTRFSELGITFDMLKPCAKLAAPAGSVYQLSEKEILEIYEMCL